MGCGKSVVVTIMKIICPGAAMLMLIPQNTLTDLGLSFKSISVWKIYSAATVIGLHPHTSMRIHHLDVMALSVEHAFLSANTGVTSISAKLPIHVILCPLVNSFLFSSIQET